MDGKIDTNDDKPQNPINNCLNSFELISISKNIPFLKQKHEKKMRQNIEQPPKKKNDEKMTNTK